MEENKNTFKEYAEQSEIISAITTEIEENYGEIYPEGHRMIYKIAQDMILGKLVSVANDWETLEKIKKYGESFKVCNPTIYGKSFMYDTFLTTIINALDKLGKKIRIIKF